MSRRFWTFISLGLVASAACGAVAEMKTFSDSFDGDLSRWGEVRGQWRIEDGVLVHGQDWDSQRLAFPETEIGDFRLDYRLRFDRIDPALRAGVSVASTSCTSATASGTSSEKAIQPLTAVARVNTMSASTAHAPAGLWPT